MGFPWSIFTVLTNTSQTRSIDHFCSIFLLLCFSILLEKEGFAISTNNAIVELTVKTVECYESKMNVKAVFFEYPKALASLGHDDDH